MYVFRVKIIKFIPWINKLDTLGKRYDPDNRGFVSCNNYKSNGSLWNGEHMQL